MSKDRILVIRHGALGDFVLSLGPCKAIRRHHRDAEIVLLTTAPFEALARASGYFDEVWLDRRAPFSRLAENYALFKRLRGAGFDRVYDLQTSSRSSLYFHFFPRRKRPEWSGIAVGASHFQDNPARGQMHTVDRQRDQLRGAGIDDVPLTDFDWVKADTTPFGLPESYMLLIPGGSAHRPEKRWPVEFYGALAGRLMAEGISPVVLAGPDEGDIGQRIISAANGGHDLTGRTNFLEIAAISKHARAGVGNDTGPSHIAALAGAPFLTLFSAASDPKRCAPRGRRTEFLRQDELRNLPVDRVHAALRELTERSRH